MVMVSTVSAPQKCDANATGKAATDWGFESIPCQVRTGLRSFMDRSATRRFYCGSEGHEADTKRRFGRYRSEIDGDGLSEAKRASDIAREDAFERGTIVVEWHGHAVDLDLD